MRLFCQPIAWDAKLDWLAHISRVLFYLEANTRIQKARLPEGKNFTAWIFADICK